MKKISLLILSVLFIVLGNFNVFAASKNINGTDITAPTAPNYTYSDNSSNWASVIVPSERSKVLVGQNTYNYNDYTSIFKAQEEYQNNLNYNIGFARLAKLIENSTNKETKMIGVKQIVDTRTDEIQYVVTISSDSWANGNWLVKVFPYPALGMGEYEQAPNGGYWFGLYDQNNNRVGTAQAYKIKT